MTNAVQQKFNILHKLALKFDHTFKHPKKFRMDEWFLH